MEYFDPKTRPHSIFLDEQVLLSAPRDVIRSTATTGFAGQIAAMSQTGLNPLAEGDRNQAFRLTHRAYLRLLDELDNPALRIDLCLAAFLQNRPQDDGPRGFRGGAFRGNNATTPARHDPTPHLRPGPPTPSV